MLRKYYITIGMFMASLLLAGNAFAELYQWMDENGVVHFSNTPPTNKKLLKQVKVIEETKRDPRSRRTRKKKPDQTAGSESNPGSEPQEPAPGKKEAQSKSLDHSATVELYVTSCAAIVKKPGVISVPRALPFGSTT